MYKEALRPAWAEINLSNLEYNIRSIQERASDSADMIGVIKADAYGHGAVKCAEVLRKCGVKTFAIATLAEGIELRNAGAKENIICLGLTPEMYAETLVQYDISPVVDDYEDAYAINEVAAIYGKTVNALVAVDTGMGRIGYRADDPIVAIKDISQMLELSHFRIKGMISHFATADGETLDFAREQERKYNDFFSALLQAGIKLPSRTFANSAAIMRMDSVHFDAVRAGIILYGGYPSPEVDKELLSLKPVMSVKANIVKIKTIQPGDSVSYGRKFIAEKPALIATIPIGYADGYPRVFSGKATMICNGVVCPVRGNICMDQCMLDVSEVDDVCVGDEVIIMGSDGTNSITAEDIGIATGTINYEVMCGFGQRLPKVYVRDNVIED